MRAPGMPHANRPAPGPQRAQRGFTLIELMTAIAVMALLAVLSWRGLDGMVRAQEQTRQRAESLLVLQAALGQWGADLDALQNLSHTTALDWDGQVLRMTRRSTAVVDEGVLVVAWTLRNVDGQGQWLRWQSLPVRTRSEWNDAWQLAAQWARTPGEAERRREVALLPLQEWRIFYHRGGAWSNPLSSADSRQPPSAGAAGSDGQPGAGTGAEAAAAAAAINTSIPEGVRLQITVAPGQALTGELTRDWISPVVGGERS